MAKKSKLQRQHERRAAELSRFKKLHAERHATVEHFKTLYREASERANRAEGRQNRLIDEILNIATCSVVMPADRKIEYARRYRVPIRNDQRYGLGAYASCPRAYESIKVEEMTMMLMSDCDLRETMARHIHLRVEAPPGGKPDFALGYAVSHTQLNSMCAPEMLTEMICRQFGHAIAKALAR